MSASQVSEPERDRRVIAAVATLVALLIVGIPMTFWLLSARSSATFSDTEILENNRLGAATLDIEVGSDAAVFDARNLAPGDVVSGHLEVTNVGSLPLTLTLSATSSGGPLADWLRFSAWTTADQCRADDIAEGRARVIAADFSISTLATGALNGEPLPLSTDETVVVCLGAALPLEAGNEIQGQTMSVNLVLDAVHDLEAEAP